MSRFGIYPATLKPTTGGDINLSQLDSHRFSPNAQKSPYKPGGSLDTLHVGLVSAKPMHSLSTCDLETVLSRISHTDGLAIDGDTTNGSAFFRYQNRICEGGFSAAATHVGRTSKKGYVKLGTLSGSEGDAKGATISLEYYSISLDGLEDPDVKSVNVDLSAVAVPSFVSRFFFGPTYLGGVKVEGVVQTSVNFGVSCDAKLFDYVYPTCYSINSRDPSITFSGPNAKIDALLSSFSNNLSAPLDVYYRRGVHGQARVGNGTASHIKVTAASGEWSLDDEGGSGQDDITSSFTVTVTGQLALSVASPIP